MLFHHAAIETLENAKAFFVRQFSTDLIGIYVHGSLVTNCFNPRLSDVDFIVVIRKPLTPEQRHDIIDFSIELDQNAPGKGVEYSIVTQDQIDQFTYPTPNELTFSYHSLDHHTREELYTLPQVPDPDLAAHFSIIFQRGVVLVGRPIKQVFRPIPKRAFMEALISDAEYIKTMITRKPFYGVLNLCRIYAFKIDGQLLSKKEGGLWALKHESVNQMYHPLIEKALEDYKTQMSDNWNNIALQDFFKDMYCKLLTSAAVEGS